MPIEWITASVSWRWVRYVVGLRMSAFTQLTDVDQGGAVEEEVTEDQVGSPERLSREMIRLEVMMETN